MENSLHQNSLLNNPIYLTLQQATSQDANVLKPAEEKLRDWETQAGYYTALCRIITTKDLDVPVRWLGTVCLKNGIDKYYRKTAPNAIAEDEKVIIRQGLIECFDEPSDVIVQQIAIIVSKIARLDWPREWPDLINILFDNIQNNENSMKRYRSLLILSHVIKTLSTKRLMGDKKLFQDLTMELFPVMLEFWNFTLQQILSADENKKKDNKFKYNLEMSLLSAKILSKLTVFGFAKPHNSSEALNFMTGIFQRIETLLQFRKIHVDFNDQFRDLIDKHIITLLKVLSSVLENHPFSYVDFIGMTLRYCFFYCFTKEGHELLFETLLIRWLNLMKAILQCPEYKLTSTTELEVQRLIIKVADEKDGFFTPTVSHDICYKLINDYLILPERDLAFWDSDPEGYAAEEIVLSWKCNLRPCVEGLFIAFLNQYKELLIPVVVSSINNSKASPDPNDISAILKKDAVYNVFGLSVFDLFDEIDFDKWFMEILIPELHEKTSNYRILRRRIAWLIGRWTGVKLSNELRPILYSELINLLEPSEDIAVRLTVANTIKDVVDDFEFRSEVFLENIPKCFQLLYTLLEESKECETKMQVLNVLSFIIERVGWEIAPFFDSLVNYLPMLWQHSEDHNMLKCAIVSVLTQIVRGLGDQCTTLEKFVIPVINYSLDMNQDGHVYLQEDGLNLFLAYLENVKNSEDIFSVFHYLPPIIEKSTEYLKMCVNIVTALLLLSPEKFMQVHAPIAVASFMELLPDIKSEGVALILQFFETCITVQPYRSLDLLRNFICDIIPNICFNDDKPTIVALRLSILARIILLSNEVFAQLVETTCIAQGTSADVLFAKFLDSWLNKMAFVWPIERKKLLSLALSNLLTVGSLIVMARFSPVISAIVEVLNDLLTNENGILEDLLLLQEERTSSRDSELDEPEQKTEHEIRVSDVRSNDSVYKVDMLWYFQNQLEELQKQVGDSNFQQLMNTVNEETVKLINLYVKKS